MRSQTTRAPFGASSPTGEWVNRRELRMLWHLPTNLSRPEIAGELSVSPNTVSTHVRSLYRAPGL